LIIGLAGCTAPPTPANLVTQGLKAQLAGNLSTARAEYRQAIQLDGNSIVAHYDLGTLYDQLGDKPLAIAEYRAALVVQPNFTDALFNLAVDTASSDPVIAQQLYLKVLSLQPTFAAAWLNVGFILESEGSGDEARADWAKAVVLAPSLASRVPTPVPTGSPSRTPLPTPTGSDSGTPLLTPTSKP